MRLAVPEPFKDCDRTVHERYIEMGLEIVSKNTLGPETYVYVSDMFLS
jgi:hypothetical protein